MDEKLIISLMSGTSIDSVDAVLVKIFPDLSFEIIYSYSLEYSTKTKDLIYLAANNKAKTRDVCMLNFIVGEVFAKCALELMRQNRIKAEKVDFISSHGQTIFHEPKSIDIDGISGRSTLQIGDISVIAERTGIMTIGDFRPKDMAAGGQGAPLVPFADELIFGRETERGILNIGGISNITVLSPAVDTFAFDIGPGNMLIDYYVSKLFKKPFDKNGEYAARGKVDEKWLNYLLKEPFYADEPPKSTGRELFNDSYAEDKFKFAPSNPHDVIATVTALTAHNIYNTYKRFIEPKVRLREIVIGGGGAYNLTLQKYMKDLFFDVTITTHEAFGIDNKLKEALAFAYLGYMTYYKKYNNLPACTGAKHQVVMGKIAY